MASTTDFKKLFERYQEEGAKRGISIAQYCQMNGIVYNQYERWYKQFRNIVATPVEIVNENVKEQTLSETVSVKEPMSVKPVSRIQIELSNGLQITHREIDYRTLCRLVEKIEGLCSQSNEGAENGHREDDNEISLSPSVGERELILTTPF